LTEQGEEDFLDDFVRRGGVAGHGIGKAEHGGTMAAEEGGERGFAAGLDSGQEFGVSGEVLRVHREVAAFKLCSV
jgi:hypothetical protein